MPRHPAWPPRGQNTDTAHCGSPPSNPWCSPPCKATRAPARQGTGKTAGRSRRPTYFPPQSPPPPWRSLPRSAVSYRAPQSWKPRAARPPCRPFSNIRRPARSHPAANGRPEDNNLEARAPPRAPISRRGPQTRRAPPRRPKPSCTQRESEALRPRAARPSCPEGRAG